MSTRPGRGHRHLPKRLRLDCRPTRQPRSRELGDAILQVHRSGVVPVLDRRLGRRSEARARLSVEGLEVTKALHAYMPGHRMLLVDLVRLVNSYDQVTLARLSMPLWRPDGGYDRIQRLHAHIARELDVGWTDADSTSGEVRRIDHRWYSAAVVRAAIPPGLIDGCALAIDGTAMETWGRLHGSIDAAVADGVAREDPGP